MFQEVWTSNVILCPNTMTPVARHAGQWKTLELVAQNYWWLQMSCYIGQYVQACDLCHWTKVQCHPPIRELVPLPVPELHWDTISINFIVKLPESHSYDTVMNAMDSMSKCPTPFWHTQQSQPSEQPPVPCTCLESAWASETSSFWSQPSIHCRIHAGTLPPPQS